VLPVYLVWSVPSYRHPWVVPPWVLGLEYGAFLSPLAYLLLRAWRRQA
jgi:hypothetical protein